MLKLSTYPSRFLDLGMQLKTIILSLIFSLTLSACSDQNASPPEAAVMLSPRLAQLFEQTCANCHTKANTGAPLAGDRQAWQKILAQGMEITLERAINGYGGMPPGGQCFECSPDDMSQLILYMSQTSTGTSLSKKPGDKS